MVWKDGASPHAQMRAKRACGTEAAGVLGWCRKGAGGLKFKINYLGHLGAQKQDLFQLSNGHTFPNQLKTSQNLKELFDLILH